ncbi:MAG: hypothetical protein ACRD4B_10605, partial [Acidobacteriota bacterium]
RKLNEEQNKLVSNVMMSLLGVTAATFVSWFWAAAVTFGFIAIKKSYDRANQDLQNLKSYRLLSYVIVIFSIAGFILPLIIYRLQ